jgi:hypothetical protein
MANSGLNRDLGPYRDDSYVRCAYCGFMCNKDRDSRAPYGSRTGDGISYRQVYRDTTIVNGVVTSVENVT